jgi:acetyl esterase
VALHPQIAEILATLPPPPDGPLDPVAMRAGDEARVPPLAERLPLHNVEDATVPSDAGDVPVRIYTPTETPTHGVIVYFHGGAFFLGSLNTHDHVARSLARETGCTVVAVGYRLVPEHAFPAGLEDCCAAVRWAAGHRDGLAGDARLLAVAGDSAGATLATIVAALMHDDGHDVITHQVLYYPSVDLDFDLDRYPSLRENAVGYGMETKGLKPYNAFYLDSGADPTSPRVSPIKRADLSGLPPALILTGEYDPLRDEGELYGRRLNDAGVPSTVTRYAGVGHGFVEHFAWLPEYYRAFTETNEFLQSAPQLVGSQSDQSLDNL